MKKLAEKGRRFHRKALHYKGKNPFACVSAGHLTPRLPPSSARVLFKKSVRMVEIEVFSFCNRTCWFCPNSHIDRHSDNILMSSSLYRKILDDLRAVDYAGLISYSRYNEPLADPIIFDRIQQARSAVPEALLHFNTNGDFFNRQTLEKIYDCGLKSMNIQVYTPENRPYSDELARDCLMRRVKRYGLNYEFVFSRPMDWLEYRLLFKDMKIRIYARNFRMNGADRGATIADLSQEKIRRSPCLVPFKDMYIDYNGKVVPCCNIRSDIAEHSDFILGDLNDEHLTLFSIFQSAAAIAFRKKLVGFHEKCFPCNTCNFAHIASTPANYKRAERILRRWS
jgi:MoaA/NifB/PqqE/SkfB family radical SAM enzyme